MKLIFTLIALCFSVLLNAQKAGTLDRSFGNNGIVTTDFDSSVDEAGAVIILPNGKIIVAGKSFAPNQSFSLAKYNEDGTLDVNFGKGGKVISNFRKTFAYTYCAALQPDGKILIGGSMSSDKGNYGDYFLLIRYNINGKIDSSFGHNGVDTTIIEKGVGGAFHSILLQPDGKIIGVGSSNGLKYDYTVIRYLSNGKIDSSFGINGITKTSVAYDYCNAGALQSDGKILAGGYSGDEFLIVRYNNNGTIDATFGNDGIVLTKFNLTGEVSCKAMALQPDGKIILGGNYQDFKGVIKVILARFNSNGTPDVKFGVGGFHLNSFKISGHCNTMALQSNGKIVLAGSTLSNIGLSFAVARYKNDGNIDSSFDDNGGAKNSFPSASFANAVAIQQDGRIVAVGEIPSPNCIICGDYGMIRYYGDNVKNIQRLNAKSIINISPNPAQNILHVQGLSSNAKLTVVDFAGNVVLSIQPSVFSSSYNLNITSLRAGNYLLKIETNGEVVTKQFVKE
jgi:uncharacterized delta-60 repeat protein